jgi:serine/threonine-protein kinase
MLLSFGAVAAVGVVGVLVLTGGGAPAPPPEAALAGATTELAVVPPQPSADPAGVPRTIELRITSSPSGAKIFLDDAPLGESPFTGRFPADGARHLVRVEAAGRATQKEFAEFTNDVTIDFDLEKKAGTKVSYHPRSAAARPTSEPIYESPAPEPGAGDPQQAGTPGKTRRSLSGSDPWSGTPVSAPQSTTTTTTTKPKRQLGTSNPWGQ